MIALFATFLAAAGAATNAPAPVLPAAPASGAGTGSVAVAVSAPPASPAPVSTNLAGAPGEAPGLGFALAPPSPPTREEAAEVEYRRLLTEDDDAQAEMDRWIREADSRGTGADVEALKARIRERVEIVDAAYRRFLERYPEHVGGRVAFGSFLNDTGREGEARAEWERALKLDPKDPAIHNNLAGTYGHSGPVTNAFVHYEKAIELDPKEPIYHQNFATTLLLFRKDVMEHYGIRDEQEVFDKSLAEYRRALELDPGSFLIASDLAQTYYLIKPPRHDDALAAWRKALELASDDLEREGVRVHLARIQVQAGRFDEARTLLATVTNANYSMLKERITRTLETREAGTNTTSAAGTTNAPPPRGTPDREPPRP